MLVASAISLRHDIRDLRSISVQRKPPWSRMNDDEHSVCRHSCTACRDGNWTRGYGYPRVSYPMDMDTGWKTHPWILSGRVPEIRRVGYG
jgi:hypothetical protein